MSKLAFLLISFVTLIARAQTILVMDTIEFNTVRHDIYKRVYVEKMTEILKKMRLKQGDFDAMNSDHHTVFELIQSNVRWNEISNEIDKQCRKKDQKANCNALANLRLKTFDDIKAHPQDYGDNAGQEKTSR